MVYTNPLKIGGEKDLRIVYFDLQGNKQLREWTLGKAGLIFRLLENPYNHDHLYLLSI